MNTDSTASRLCNACGLCCNGVLFHLVELQPADSPNLLLERGLKLKWKRGHRHIEQPCPAYRNSCCTIYEFRPERCRRFECRQLKAMHAGEISELQAHEKIAAAKALVARLEALLAQAGVTNPRRPISKRFEAATATPLDETAAPAALELQAALFTAMEALGTLLEKDFHVPKEVDG